MVEKKLNFNQPILSVRKHSHKVTSHIVDQREGFPVIHRLPPHRPERSFCSRPVGNPVSVPFQWEQIPGRPKEEILAQSNDYARPFVWEQIPGQPKEDILAQSHDHARPSVWEHIPGRPKDDILAQSYNYARPSVSPEPQRGVEALRETSSDSDVSSESIVEDLGVRQREHERRKVVYQEKSIVLHCRPSFKRGGSDQYENVIRVSCLIPRAFLKSSVCSLSPVPAMSRAHAMTFPGSRMLCESAVFGSSTDSENVVMSRKARGYQQRYMPFLVEAPSKKSLRTLRELLDADDAARIVENSESYVKTSGVMKINEDSYSDSDSDHDLSSEDDIRTAVNEAAENARKRLAREGDAPPPPPPPPPPLPKSPSDSWLSRTLSSTSVGKARSSVFMSRLSNKYY